MAVRNTGRAGPPLVGGIFRASLGMLLCAGLLLGTGQTADGEALDWETGIGTVLSHQPVTNEPLESPSIANVATTIKLYSSEIDRTGATYASHRFPHFVLPSADSGALARRLLAVPDGAAPVVESLVLRRSGGDLNVEGARLARAVRIEEIGKLREQTVATLVVDPAALETIAGSVPFEGIEIAVTFEGARTPSSVSTGPLSGVCARTLQNYEIQPEDALGWRPPASGAPASRDGSIAYCPSVADCAQNGVDILFIVAEELSSTPALFAYATHHASYFGLNIGIVSMADMADRTPETLHQFIQDVYETESAEHFGDGHLGFVVLVGDAYADDNQTVMVPVYNGYGGVESASDHYYACVSGDDDFEDVMVGRLSVGNLGELTAALSKSASYMPLTPDDEPWHDRVLLVGGLFYTTKDNYVALFDEYDELIPDDLVADRLYRHDYGTDEGCALDVVDAFNDGYLFVNFSGDGWISSWGHTLNTGHIDLMQNAPHLPIVLSMACMTGWLDNVTEPDGNGSYDCLAEQLVNAPNGGAVACLAAPRSSDGGIFQTLSKEILRAAFEQNCVFTGELVATAKLLHLQNGGDPSYTRQFNLFGDPTLVFGWDVEPTARPDLTTKPYQTVWSPSEAVVGEALLISVGVSNQSSVPAADVVVRIHGESDGGSYEYESIIPWVGPWGIERAEFVLQSMDVGNHVIDVTADPYDSVQELHEDNNSFSHSLYAYPSVPGFPVDLGEETHSPCVVNLHGTARNILIPDGDARIWSLDSSGSTDWVSTATWGASSYGREIAAAAGDLDGDGMNEVVATKYMGVVALDADGGEIWTANTDDPLGYPVLADGDSDGDLDVIVSTRASFGGPSSIVAIDEEGSLIWSYALPQGVDITTAPAAGDFDLDGNIDIAYGTSEGTVEALSCATVPPTSLWGPVAVDDTQVSSLGLADLDLDGLLEVVVAAGKVRCVDAESGTDAGWNVDLGGNVVTLAIGDTDQDGFPEVFAGASTGSLSLIRFGVPLWSRSVSGIPGSSAAITDVDGSGSPEILIGTDAGRLHVFSSDGSDYVSPMPLQGECLTPFASDLNGDGAVEVTVCSSSGRVYAFSFGGAARQDAYAVDWLGLGRSATRTSILEQPFWGAIDGNLVLSGNFQVVDDVIVPTGSTLTIAAEARLAFHDQSVLRIDGTFHAPGIPGGEILMTSSPEARARWKGLEVGSGASVYMASCVVTEAVVGLEAVGAAVDLTDCEFTGNGSGAYLRNCSLYASSTSFSMSDGVGLEIDGGSGAVVDCAMDGNGTAGLKCIRGSGYRFARSVFSGTTGGHGAEFIGSSQAQVDSCSFAYNSGSGALVKTSSPTFEMCDFSDNATHGIECERLSFPTVGWCTITGNRIGVVCRTSSFPNLGKDQTLSAGQNGIYGNQQAALASYNTEPTPVYARRNWWGVSPPAGRIFFGYIVYTPWLTEPPDASLYTSDVAESDADYGLSQNRPNPFNPVTTLTFSAPPADGIVRITVHDSSGRLVRTLYAAAASPGKHEVVWDGLDNRGNMVASGVYFAKMSAPDFGAVRKMLLLK